MTMDESNSSQPNEILKRINKAAMVDRNKYVYNDILGYVTKDLVEEALRLGAISFRDDAYWVTTEERLVAIDDEGKPLRHPRKVRRVSKAYIQFMEKINGTKINS